MAIRLIAFDMDDTLLRDDRTIGERTLRALRAAHEQGVKIIPATGRGKHSMWNFVQQMGVADAAICTNGAQVYDAAGRPVMEHPVPLETALRVARFAKENGWYLQGYSENDYFFDHETDETQLYARLANHMGQAVGDLEKYMTEPPFKLLFVQTDPEKMQRLKDTAIPLFGKEMCLFVSKPFYLEITDPKATKGAALLALAEKVDPALNDIILEKPKAMAAFLRTASGMSEAQLAQFQRFMEAEKKATEEAKKE